jgi:hypothetical protein
LEEVRALRAEEKEDVEAHSARFSVRLDTEAVAVVGSRAEPGAKPGVVETLQEKKYSFAGVARDLSRLTRVHEAVPNDSHPKFPFDVIS